MAALALQSGQLALGRDSDRGMAEALTHDFERDARLNAVAVGA